MSFNIIIPCFNSAKTLPRTIDSLLKQEQHLASIILIDDGSTDETANIAKSYLMNFPRYIEYHYQDNQGPARARNHGMDFTDGEYTLFLDADDTLSPDALENFSNAFQDDPDVEILIAGYCSHHADKKRVRIPKVLDSRIDILKAFWFGGLSLCGGAVAMKTTVLELAHYPENIRHNEDIVFFSHLIAQHQTKILPFVALHVYHHQDSLRHQSDSALRESDSMINLMFDDRFFSREIMALKNKYHAIKLVSLAKICKKLEQKDKLKYYLKQALEMNPMIMLEMKNIKLLISGLF